MINNVVIHGRSFFLDIVRQVIPKRPNVTISIALGRDRDRLAEGCEYARARGRCPGSLAERAQMVGMWIRRIRVSYTQRPRLKGCMTPESTSDHFSSSTTLA